MNGIESSSDEGTLDMIENAAQRWGMTRFDALWPSKSQVEGAFDGMLYDELRDQGWLPASAEELQDWSARTVARLGRSLGHEAASAFLPVLAHVMAAFLLPANQFPRGGRLAPLFAMSPFWDFSFVRSPLSLHTSDGRKRLTGKLPMVIDANETSLIVVPASSREGEPAIVAVAPDTAGVIRHEPRPTLGLRGPCVRTIEFASVAVEECFAQGEETRRALAKASRILAFGSSGLLIGITRKATKEAAAYARLRVQGGKPIAEHGAVAKLLGVADSAARQLELWMSQLDDIDGSIVALDDARAAALTATDAAMQVFGGIGYICPGVPERCWRDARQAAALASRKGYFV